MGLIPAPKPSATARTATGPGPTQRSRAAHSTRPGSSAGARRKESSHLPFDLVAAYMALGLDPSSDKQRVRQRLRQLMKEAHPDLHPPEQGDKAARRLRELTRARDTLRRHGRLA